jgi:two-component system KDP operon response regulator KdpE
VEGKTILVVDDDTELLQLLEMVFTRADARVCSAVDGQDGLRQFYSRQPDLVLLDLMMPRMDGWQMCRRIRQLCGVPVIMLTALGRDEDVIRGLDAGADDYMSKPFDIDVLLARVRAVLRRTENTSINMHSVTFSDGHLSVDLETREVLVGGKPVKLSRKEYRLLACLLQNPGRVFTFQQILDYVWGERGRDRVQYVHVYVSRLRQKLEADPGRPAYILGERGVGYFFESKMPGAYRPVSVGRPDL